MFEHKVVSEKKVAHPKEIRSYQQAHKRKYRKIGKSSHKVFERTSKKRIKSFQNKKIGTCIVKRAKW
jgi:hypothetical protein